MKNVVLLLAGLIIGLIAGILLYPSIHSETDRGTKEESGGAEKIQVTDDCDPESLKILDDKARGITLKNAWKLFDDYHGVTNPGSGKAGFTTTVFDDTNPPREKNIESIYLPYKGFLDKIEQKVRCEGKKFLGLAGVPGYNSHPDTLSHTMIWVPLIEGENGERLYFIPEQDAENFIYDYVGICPDDCPENRCDLWKRDWDPNAAPSSQCDPGN